MSEGRNPFGKLSKRNKVILASVLGSVLFLSTLTPVLNIPLLPSSLLPAVIAAPPEDNPGKKLGQEKKDSKKFHLEEATISDIHKAIQSNEITCQGLVQAYINRAAAYNGVCTQLVTEDGASIPPATGYVRAGAPIEFPTETVAASDIFPNLDEYEGLPLDLGRMEATISDPSVQQQYGMIVGIPNAGQLNALETINIRGERSVTCKGAFDAHPSSGPLPEGAPEECEEFRQQPDALERAAELDAQYGSNPPLDELPMYCIPFASKVWFDTKDMRSTGGNDVNLAMDVPPVDSSVIAQIRAKGAIIYAIASASQVTGGVSGPIKAEKNFFGAGTRSTWGGNACNPYDTARDAEASSSGSGASVAANLAACAICEQTGFSCYGPASRNGVVSLVTTKSLISYGGTSSTGWFERAGIHCRTVGDTVLVLDALRDPERGYYDPRDMYTALPKALVSEEPYANFVVDEKDIKKKPLEGMRIGIVREFMVKHVQNDVAISDQINNEIKSVLRDKLGAELVESVDPLYPDDPTIANMHYTFHDAIAEILPFHMPEYLFQMTADGALEFAVPGHDVTTKSYMVKLALGQAPLPDNLNMRRLTGSIGAFFPDTRTTLITYEKYLLERGDEKVKDFAGWVANAKYFSDAGRASAENAVGEEDIRSEGATLRMKIRDVLRLVVLKVMYENNIDAFVHPANTIAIAKIGGPSDPLINSRPPPGFLPSAALGAPEITVPAGFNQIIYEPKFVLRDDKKSYTTVTGTEQSLLDSPLPIAIVFWAGPGEEPVIIKVASAYEAATNHRTPPPDFGPLPGEP